MKKAGTIIIVLLAVVVVSGFLIYREEASPISGATTAILIEQDGPINQNLCEERGFNDKIIVIESKYCGACRIAVPILKEIEQELNTEFIFLDLSKDEDQEYVRDLGIVPAYTPTMLVGCEVIIGAQSKEFYQKKVEAFLNEAR